MQRQRSLFHVQEGNSDVTRSWNSATGQYRQVNATQGKRRDNKSALKSSVAQILFSRRHLKEMVRYVSVIRVILTLGFFIRIVFP